MLPLLLQGVCTTWHCGTFQPYPFCDPLTWTYLHQAACQARKENFWIWPSFQCITLPRSCVAHWFWEKALDRKLSKCYCMSYVQCLGPHNSCLTMAESFKVLQRLAWIMASDPNPKSHPHRTRRAEFVKALRECSLKQDGKSKFHFQEDHTVTYREPNNYLPLTTPMCGPPDVQHKLPKHSMKKQQCLPERWKVEMHISSDNEGKPFSHLPSCTSRLRAQDVDFSFQ